MFSLVHLVAFSGGNVLLIKLKFLLKAPLMFCFFLIIILLDKLLFLILFLVG